MTGRSLSPSPQSVSQTLKNYYQLTKPRIIPLLLITTAASMWIASGGVVDTFQLLITLIGGTLAAASAQVMNCIYDQDIDLAMARTSNRPLPSGQIKTHQALIFAIALGVLSFSLLSVFVNLYSALLAMAGIGFYMVIYTHWLKRHHTQNIVIGGAAGAIPPLVGWAAVTGELGWPAWMLFTLIFLWTPPHFWALALMIKDDYAQVNVPMLPVVAGEEETVRQIWIYTLIVVPFSFLLIYPLGTSGLLYGAIALVLGFLFVVKAWSLKQEPHSKAQAKSLFKYSILYMMLLCGAMVVDSLPTVSRFSQHFGDNMQQVLSLIPMVS